MSEDITVHVLLHGFPLCNFTNEWPPSRWPEGHRWVYSDDLHHCSCNDCMAAVMDPSKLLNLVATADARRAQIEPDPGRVQVRVALLEFDEHGNTIWIHSPTGATVLRIKTNGKIILDPHCGNLVAHTDVLVDDDIHFCIPKESHVHSDDDTD